MNTNNPLQMIDGVVTPIFQPQTRPCAVNGHQIYWEGFFHAFVNIGDQTFALVESKSGSVEKVSLETYTIKFLDR